MSQYLLSVCLITYNHEKYISEAIEGVLMQKVDFEWELIIADDFSTDNTRKILLEYKEKYPNFIKLILQDKNVGPAKNWNDLITSPKSKYIAYFEGDDYWTDPYKLQKQVDFLEKNNDYGLVCTNYYILEGDNIKENNFTAKNSKTEPTIKDLLFNNPIGSLTTVFRNKIIKTLNIPDDSLIGDMLIWLHIASLSKIRYFDEYTGVYRVLQNSASRRNDLEKRYKFLYCAYEIVNKYAKNVSLTKQERKKIYMHRMYPLFENLSIRKKIFPFIKLYIQYTIYTRSISIIPIKLFFFHLFKTKHKPL